MDAVKCSEETVFPIAQLQGRFMCHNLQAEPMVAVGGPNAARPARCPTDLELQFHGFSFAICIHGRIE
jgi:hypothetical protein